MIRFYCDYDQSAHPKILSRLQELAAESHAGYGEDEHCKKAAQLIRTACGTPEADVHFLVGGTQTNTTLISAILRPHQGVVSADTGHVATHETGAIEATGHKVITLPGSQGKISAQQVDDYVKSHWENEAHEHVVQPGMVYISHPTESGTMYTLAELEALSGVCKAHNIPLMLDGARMAYGLAARGADLSLEDIARLCDVFYIGGTKVGALFGEAVVITNEAYKADFRYLIKRHGGLLAKGFLLGIQFECLFEDGLYFDLGKHGVEEAMVLRQGILDAGFPLAYDAGANQQFAILPNAVLEALRHDFSFAHWEKLDDKQSIVRFCTSWATKREEVEALIKALHQVRL